MQEAQRAALIDKVQDGVVKIAKFRRWRLAQRLKLEPGSNLTHYSTAAGLSDGTLLELKAYFDLWSAPPDPIWTEPGLRVFVSHVSDARERLAELKAKCAVFGINLFLAHDNIEEGTIWADSLRRALESMDAMLTVHSPGFGQSAWTGQEIGFALCRKVPIISLMDGEPPCGFLQDRQGFKWKPKEEREVAAKILARLNQTDIAAKMGEALSRRLQDTDSYGEADLLVTTLDECPIISETAAHSLNLVFKYNDQVYASNEERLREVMAKHGHLLVVMDAPVRETVDF